jgi:putative ABC transport system permease protein
MTDRLLGVLMKQPHVTLATGTVVQPLAGLDTITGLDLSSFDKMSGGFHFLQGGPFRADNDILVDEYYAKEHRFRVGDTVRLINHDWRLAGIFESVKLTRIAVKLSVLQELTGNPNHLSQIFIKVDNSNNIGTVVEELKKLLPGYPIYTMEEFTSLLSISSVGLLRNFIGVVIGVAVVVGFIVVYMAMYTAVLERTREIGILKSLGASSRLILSMLLMEALLFACLGVLAGILLTYGTQWTIAHLVPSSLNQETVYAWWPLAAAIAGALLGAIGPITKAVRQDVTDALAYE